VIRRFIGFLLILKALGPFIWLFVGYLIVGAIGERVGHVSGSYSVEFEVQAEAYFKLLDRVDKQLSAIEPMISRAVDKAAEDLGNLTDYVLDTVALLKRLPTIDLSRIMPDIRFPPIPLPRIDLNWQVPNIPIVGDAINAVRGAIQSVADSVNSALGTVTGAIADAMEAALAPLRNQLVANVMRQFAPYLDAYDRVSKSMAFVGDYYDSVADEVDKIQAEFAKSGAAWAAIGDDFASQFELSTRAFEMVPYNLDSVLGESGTLLIYFGLLTLALFLVFYWATMLGDLQRGWSLLTGRYEQWKRRQAEPREPALDRLLAKLEAKQAGKPAA
jgi:hypothetical protein